jgi:hypothetical protein
MMRADLKKHMIVSVGLPLFFAAVLLIEMYAGKWAAVLAGSLAVIIVKEVLDPLMGGQRDWKDARYSIPGLAAGMVALYLVGWR